MCEPRLIAAGIRPGQSRPTALFALAEEVPAAILSHLTSCHHLPHPGGTSVTGHQGCLAGGIRAGVRRSHRPSDAPRVLLDLPTSRTATCHPCTNYSKARLHPPGPIPTRQRASGRPLVSSCTDGRIPARPTGRSRPRVQCRRVGGGRKAESLRTSEEDHRADGCCLRSGDPRAVEVCIEGRRPARASAGDRRDCRGDPASTDHLGPAAVAVSARVSCRYRRCRRGGVLVQSVPDQRRGATYGD